MFPDKKIVLASLSPRRKQLLEQAEIEFVIRVSPVQEDYPPEMDPVRVPEYIAFNKAAAVKETSAEDEIIIGADTLVLLGNRIIAKPEDEAGAARILQALSGSMHRVITGVCLMKGKKEKVFSDVTEVYFRKLHKSDIAHYIEKYRPLDKAGAYAIQEWIGLVGIERINGCYFNVMGLPVGRVIEAIRKF